MSAERLEAGELVAEARRLVEEAYYSGLGCAEAVLSALAKVQGVESEHVQRMATAFCSGMAYTRGPCGALTGAVMGLSLALGRSDPRQRMDASIAAAAELTRAFEHEFGGRNCDQLLGCDIGTPEGAEAFREQCLYERCERYTIRAAELAALLLARPRSEE